METKYGFTKLCLPEFASWLQQQRVSRTIIKIQQHHTYIPSYIHFTGNNHFERQKAMRDAHVNDNGWKTIGQHFTIFPDGSILTGRSLEDTPAGIYGQNANAICVENFGYFDISKDVMTAMQKASIVGVTAALCQRFNIPVSTDFIVYHHWFDLSTGARNNGSRNNKSCPGTNFFGGNKVDDCKRYFLPLVTAALQGNIKTDTDDVEQYVCVKASALNVRTAPDANAARAADRPSVPLGAILRVYDSQGDWLKISKSDPRWVAARYTIAVQRAVVNAQVLNVRSGPGTQFTKNGSLYKGDIVFVSETKNNWCKISVDEKWVSKQYLDF